MPHQKPMKWVLPEVVNPPDTICYQINVPNERAHIAAFLGAIFLLSKPYAWGDDPAHTALEVGAVWRAIFDNLLAGNCTIPPKQGSAGAEGDENLIRQNPDNPCELQTSINGTDWCTFADLSKCFPVTQPGTGAQQPAPGGGCATYQGLMGAQAPWYVPTVVNPGDTIEIINPQGAWNGGDPSFWHCFDGQRYLAGHCVGQQFTDGGDPLPTAPHMTTIAIIGSSVYDLGAGPITVGAGPSNQQVLIQCNDSALGNNAGSISFQLKVCNNQSVPTFRNDNFVLNQNGWVPLVAGGGLENGVWVPTEGFADTLHLASGFDYRAAGCMIDLPSFTLTDFVVKYNVTTGTNDSGASPGIFILYNSDTILTQVLWTAIVDGDNQTIEFHGSIPGVTHLGIFVGASNVSGSGDGGGSALITSALVQGT